MKLFSRFIKRKPVPAPVMERPIDQAISEVVHTLGKWDTKQRHEILSAAVRRSVPGYRVYESRRKGEERAA